MISIKGLPNRGADCYFNSLVQALLSLKLPDNEITRLIGGAYTYGIGPIAKSLKTPMPPGQQCSLELWDHILDTVNMDIDICIRYRELTVCECGLRIEHGNQKRENYSYHMVIASNPKMDQPIDEAMLKYSGVVERVCECGAQRATRVCILKRLGTILTLVFPHYAMVRDRETLKRLYNIKLPDKLVFPSGKSNRTYQLRSTVCHSGSPSGGHYWAFAKRGNQWYVANDQSVGAVPQPNNRGLRIAFYQLCV
jgi:hypothetical protein